MNMHNTVIWLMLGVIFGRISNIYYIKKVGFRYRIIELFIGIVYITIGNIYGLTCTTLYYILLVSLLIIITFIDVEKYIIPNELIIFGLISSFVINILGYGISLKDSLLGGLICGSGMLIIIRLTEFILKKEVMGGGDIKLLFMNGLFLGTKLGLLTILLSIYIGTIYGLGIIMYSKIKNQEYKLIIPYGPFISIASLTSVLCGTSMINWYIGLFL